MIELAAVIAAVAFLVLVGYLIPTILQLKRTVGQSERLLAKLNHELPFLLKEVKGSTENVHAMTSQARQGVEQASVLFNAVGEVGKTVNQVHGTIRGRGAAFVIGLTKVLAGVRAASSTVKQRMHKD